MPSRSTATERATHLRAARALAGALALIVGVFAFAVPAGADSREELEEQQRQNEEEQERVASALEGTNADLAETYLELDSINRRLPIAEAELVEANAELAAAERHRDSVQGRLEVAQAQREDLNAEIADGEDEIAGTETAMGEVARSAYRGGSGVSTLTVVLDATSPSEFANQFSVMNTAMRTQNQALVDLENLTAVNRNRQVRLEAVEVRIEELRIEAEEAVAEADAAQQQAADLVVEIETLKADQEAHAEELEELREEYAGEQSRLEDEQNDLADQIAEIARAEAAERERQRREAERERQRQAERDRQNQTTSPPSSGGGNSGGNNSGGGNSGGGSSSSHFIAPITRSLYVTSAYGYRNHPIVGGRWFHYGVDLRSACGEPQRAAANGTVVEVRPTGSTPTSGNQVLINHGVMGGNSYVTVTNHLSRFNVSVGQRVSQGDIIGYTGMTGNVTGCHVHFEIWRNGSTINPMTVF